MVTVSDMVTTSRRPLPTLRRVPVSRSGQGSSLVSSGYILHAHGRSGIARIGGAYAPTPPHYSVGYNEVVCVGLASRRAQQPSPCVAGLRRACAPVRRLPPLTPSLRSGVYARIWAGVIVRASPGCLTVSGLCSQGLALLSHTPRSLGTPSCACPPLVCQRHWAPFANGFRRGFVCADRARPAALRAGASCRYVYVCDCAM